jgi:serine/threonine-protein kinase RsbW
MIKKLKINSKIANLRIVENAIDEISAAIGLRQESYGKILVSVSEAVNNAIIHGNKADDSKFVEINISFKKNSLSVTVSDEGSGFKPGEIPDPTKPENIEKINGRGVFLMSRLADKIEFNEQGNCVTMFFKDVQS